MDTVTKYNGRYVSTILSSCFGSDVGLSYKQAQEALERTFETSQDKEQFIMAVCAILLDTSTTFMEKSQHWVEQTWASEEDARDFFAFIWQSITDEPWPSELPKADGTRFIPKPGYARGY